jgi:hypothetical protein
MQLKTHALMQVATNTEAISLPEFFRRGVRLVAEEGQVCVPYGEL